MTIDPKTKHWVLTVHIADVGAFVKPGGALDAEARKRATSVYLPQKVIPMFPEVISNGLASLQEGKVRVREDGADGVHAELAEGPRRVLQRRDPQPRSGSPTTRCRGLLDSLSDGEPRRGRGREADIPRSRPRSSPCSRGCATSRSCFARSESSAGRSNSIMPEAVLEYDADGRVSGAHFAEHNLSHQIIEEFMLAANEAVAEHFTRHEVPFLRRVHPAPNEEKLEAFAQFADLLGYPIKRPQDRFELQRVLTETADKPERAAVHFALLRSLKQATYSPIQDEHYALASQHYCHFTSPIRRYPDLQVHRLLDGGSSTARRQRDVEELTALGDHCSKMERRAETAERELVKLRMLTYLSGGSASSSTRSSPASRTTASSRRPNASRPRGWFTSRRWWTTTTGSTRRATRWKGSERSAGSGWATACASKWPAWMSSGGCSICDWPISTLRRGPVARSELSRRATAAFHTADGRPGRRK